MATQEKTDLVSYWLSERRFGDVTEVVNQKYDVLQVLSSKQVGAKVNLVPKLFVIGNFTIFLFDQNQHKPAKKLDREALNIVEIPFLDVISLENLKSKAFKLTIKVKGQQPNSLEFRTDKFLKPIFEEILKQRVKIGGYLPLPELINVGQLNLVINNQFEHKTLVTHFLETFKAWSCYFNEPVNKAVEPYVNFLLSKEERELDVTQIPGYDPQGVHCYEILPLISALQHDPYFRGLILKEFPLTSKPILEVLCDVIKNNQYLTKLVVNGLDASDEAINELCSAFSENKDIQILDLSKTKLTNFPGLINGTSFLTHLYLSNCNIPPAVSSKFFESLSYNEKDCQKLTVFHFANNKFDANTCVIFGAWVEKISKFGNMQELNISGTAINYTVVFPKVQLLTGLTYLDTSFNPIVQRADVIALNNAMPCFKDLDTFLMEGVISDIPTYPYLTNILLRRQKFITMSIAGCAVFGPSLPSIFERAFFLVKLDISSMNLNDQQFSEAIPVISNLRNLVWINLNNILTTPSIPEISGESLVTALILNSTVRELKLQGWGLAQMEYIFKKWRDANSSVTNLDISNNGMGDSGAVCLAEFLILNKGIKSISLDNNGIRSAGWLILHNALLLNSTLENLSWSTNDIVEASNPQSDKGGYARLKPGREKSIAPPNVLKEEKETKVYKKSEPIATQQEKVMEIMMQIQCRLRKVPKTGGFAFTEGGLNSILSSLNQAEASHVAEAKKEKKPSSAKPAKKPLTERSPSVNSNKDGGSGKERTTSTKASSPPTATKTPTTKDSTSGKSNRPPARPEHPSKETGTSTFPLPRQEARPLTQFQKEQAANTVQPPVATPAAPAAVAAAEPELPHFEMVNPFHTKNAQVPNEEFWVSKMNS